MLRPLTVLTGLIFLMMFPLTTATALEPPAPGTAMSGQSPSDTGIGILLLDIPAATQTDPRARSYIVDHLQPGTTIERRVRVKNNTGTDQTVRVYPGAAEINDNVFQGKDGPAENPVTSWTTLSDDELELAPGTAADVLVTITAPKDAPETEQYAAIWAEARSISEENTKIVSASRVGIRVYLSVGPGNGPPADFTIDALSASRNGTGAPEVTTTVTNTGGRALDITGSLSLANGPGGLSAAPTAINQGTTIAPGDTAPVIVALPPELPNGPWEATLELESGLVTHEASATVTFPETSEDPIAAPMEKGLPWLMLIAAAAVLGILGVLLWFILRHRAARRSGLAG